MTYQRRVAAVSRMEAQTAQPPSAAAYTRCVMLEQYSDLAIHKSSRCAGNSSCAAGDAKTLVAARTSLGHRIQFSLQLADPLAASRLRIIPAPDNAVAYEVEYRYRVVAAHGDSLLVRAEQYSYQYSATDYFVYNAGDAAADPPRPSSLSLLPPCNVFNPGAEPVRDLDDGATGLLRCGDDELVVAELRTAKLEGTKLVKVTELCLFRSGEWSVISPPISYGGDTGGSRELPSWWRTVIPIGDRKLCWVQPWRDVVICDDVFEEIPRLQYLRLPKDPSLGLPLRRNSNVCATSDGGALRFVNIFPRCCCGGAGASKCERSHHAYTVHTWTLRIDGGGGGGMEWVKDGMVDSSELWALDAYKALPRVPLDHPTISLDELEPHVVYFQLCERRHVKPGGKDTLWLLKIDMRSKTIQSVSRREDGFSYNLLTLIPSNVFHFFNSHPSNASDDGALMMEQSHVGIKRQPVVVIDDDEQLVREDDTSNPTLQPSSSSTEPSEPASEFLEAFLEIFSYGLGGEELKAYRILSQNNGRRFRSLLRIPKNLRKDWLLMEIKANQAY